jgi:hypothetical protein
MNLEESPRRDLCQADRVATGDVDGMVMCLQRWKPKRPLSQRLTYKPR